MAYQAYPSVAKTTLGGGSSLAEVYIPLWVYSSGISSNGGAVSAGAVFGYKGGAGGTNAGSNTKLHTLSSGWQSQQKFAFEASIYTSNSIATAYAALWDFTTGTIVSGSTISTNATAATVIRSGNFTLASGHQYGITFWESSGSYVGYITKAHLIALLI